MAVTAAAAATTGSQVVVASAGVVAAVVAVRPVASGGRGQLCVNWTADAERVCRWLG
jgi:hypothetical protein